MKKAWKRLAALGILAAMIVTGSLIVDRIRLRQDLLRLHVVGASDSEEDQAVKHAVRDAVIDSLRQGLSDMTDVEAVCAYVEEMLPKLKQAADRVLETAGMEDRVTVSLGEEPFPRRDYETFSLPAGVYRSLRVTIGKGEGRNWWCVVFPQLCYGEKSGFSDSLDDTISGKREVRFWLLDQLGKLENFFFHASDGR